MSYIDDVYEVDFPDNREIRLLKCALDAECKWLWYQGAANSHSSPEVIDARDLVYTMRDLTRALTRANAPRRARELTRPTC